MIRPGKHDLARSPFLGVHDVKDKIGRQPKRDLIRFSFFPCPPTAKPATHGWHFLTKPISKLTKLIESLTLLRPFFSFPMQLSSKSFLRKLGCLWSCVLLWRDRDLLRDKAFWRGFKMAVGEFFFTPLVLFIVPKYCHDEFFVNFNFFHGI